MSPEELYVSLGRLIEAQPDLDTKPISGDGLQWLGRAYALVLETGDLSDAMSVKSLAGQLHQTQARMVLPHIRAILYRALAVAEAKAPAQAQGMFINAGNSFDAMAAVGKVLASAAVSARIVDPYMDDKVLTDFAVLAPDGIRIELLTDDATAKASLQPAIQRWKQQYTAVRQLEGKRAIARSLHDRLIVVDATTVWTLTQSFNALAARSPATIVRLDGDAVPLKIAAYEAFWQGGTTIV